MLSQEVEVGNQTTINVSLKSDAIDIKEVVVTALGIKREQKALGYSVQAVDGQELQKVTGVDVSTSLTGKVAGVLVQNSSDFNSEPQIFIRGEEDPLIVIDGIAYANKRFVITSYSIHYTKLYDEISFVLSRLKRFLWNVKIFVQGALIRILGNVYRAFANISKKCLCPCQLMSGIRLPISSLTG